MISRASNVCVFDFETNGLNPYHNRIIEVAGITQSKLFHSLCNVDGEPLPKKITEITNISDEMLRKAPNERYVLSRFIHSIGKRNKVCYLVAHNCYGFDELFLKSRCQYYSMRLPGQWRFLDTLLISKLLYRDRDRYNQASLCRDFSIVQERAHRADDDVKCLSQLFTYLVEDFASTRNLPLKTDADLYDCLDAIWREINFCER
jgi:DNA polymerase-3 subunit alpha (Gram-positive type)